ncbi:MAG: epoxyqueuosine reductase QueH [Erysipelotrichaceae bacterium]
MKFQNDHQEELDTLAKIKQQNTKPSLLLHSCCGPCNAWPLLYLSEYFNITLFFNNNNIYPSLEYETRLQELLAYVKGFNEQYGTTMEVIVVPYDYDTYEAILAPLQEEREGGARCRLCYATRIKQAFAYADAHRFDYTTTVMSISRQKKSATMNEIGRSLQPLFPHTKYFVCDLKKGAGHAKSSAIAKEVGMYRQTYCGCRFSLPKTQDETR